MEDYWKINYGRTGGVIAVIALITAVISLCIIIAGKKKNGQMPQEGKDRAAARPIEIAAMLMALEGVLMQSALSIYMAESSYLHLLDGRHFRNGIVIYLLIRLPSLFLIFAGIHTAFVCMEKQDDRDRKGKWRYEIVLCESAVAAFPGCMLGCINGFWSWTFMHGNKDKCLSNIFFIDSAILMIALIAAVVLKAGRKKGGETPQESERKTVLKVIGMAAMLVALGGVSMLIMLVTVGICSGKIIGVYFGFRWLSRAAFIEVLFSIFMMLAGISVAFVCREKRGDVYKKGSRIYRSARLVLCESAATALSGYTFWSLLGYYGGDGEGAFAGLTVVAVVIAVVSLIIMMANRKKSRI